MQVTRALELTLDAAALKRMRGQGTEDLDAYLAYVQARTLLASDRVADVEQAIEHLERATALDSKFAAGYVALAEAEMFVAEYDVTEDRQARFERALGRGRTLVEQALSLDPGSGEAYLVRASINAYTDLAAAETDYRHGLELSPNSPMGYAGLAAVVYEDPARRNEALALLDRARKLDPLQPAYDVTKAMFLSYERGDVQGAADLLADVLRRNPDYQPALARMGELRSQLLGQTAAGIEYGERALSLDPLSEGTRRMLVRAYLDVGDVVAAQQVVDEADHELSVRSLPILMYQRDWRRAGEAAYDSLSRQTYAATDIDLGILAMRMYARATGDYERARLALVDLSRIRQEPSGDLALPDRAVPGPGRRGSALGWPTC